MAEMQVDYARATASAGRLREHMARFAQEHAAQAPDFNPAAAGRGFVGHGQRLAHLMAQLHERSGQRGAVMDSTALAAQRELDAIESMDTQNSDALSRHRPGDGAR